MAGSSRICGTRTKAARFFEIGWPLPSWRRNSERNPNTMISAAT